MEELTLQEKNLGQVTLNATDETDPSKDNDTLKEWDAHLCEPFSLEIQKRIRDDPWFKDAGPELKQLWLVRHDQLPMAEWISLVRHCRAKSWEDDLKLIQASLRNNTLARCNPAILRVAGEEVDRQQVSILVFERLENPNKKPENRPKKGLTQRYIQIAILKEAGRLAARDNERSTAFAEKVQPILARHAKNSRFDKDPSLARIQVEEPLDAGPPYYITPIEFLRPLRLFAKKKMQKKGDWLASWLPWALLKLQEKNALEIGYVLGIDPSIVFLVQAEVLRRINQRLTSIGGPLLNVKDIRDVPAVHLKMVLEDLLAGPDFLEEENGTTLLIGPEYREIVCLLFDGLVARSRKEGFEAYEILTPFFAPTTVTLRTRIHSFEQTKVKRLANQGIRP